MFDYKKYTLRKLFEYTILLAYIAFSLVVVPYHEHWADEIQALLITKENSLSDILIRIPQQEGQPILWHLLLKLGLFIFGNGINISYISVFVMSVAVWIIVFKYDIPLIYKVLLPFGYFFMYQYNIVSRNYCLAYLGLALVGLLYSQRHQKIWPYILSLAFLAETTSFYYPVAGIMACFYVYEIYQYHRQDYKKYLLPLSFLLCVGLSILWQIFPLNVFEYEVRRNDFSFLYVLGAFFISQNIYVNIIFLIMFILYLFTFLNPKRFSCSDKTPVIYALILYGIFLSSLLFIRSQWQHQGLIWGIFLFSFYIFFPNCIKKKSFFMLSILLLHVYWTISACRFDIKNISSPQYAVLSFLKQNNLSKETIFPVGYQTLPFLNIFPRKQLAFDDDSTLYYKNSLSDYNKKFGLEKVLHTKAKLILIDVLYYQEHQNEIMNVFDAKNYNLFVFPAFLPDKDYEGYNQYLYLFVKKNLLKNSKG